MLYRFVLRAAAAIGIACSLAGVAAVVYSATARFSEPLLAAGGGALLASGLAAAVCALLLDSAEAELARLRHERDVLEAERDVQRSRLKGLERRAEGLSLVREIHRCTNIVVRGERLRQILSVIGRLGEEVEATLFAREDRDPGTADAPGGLRLRAAAHLMTSASGSVFLRLDRPLPADKGLSIACASSTVNGPRRELAADVTCDAERVGRIEASLTGSDSRDPTEVLRELLAGLELSPGAAAQAAEHGQVVRHSAPGASGPRLELLYPLAAEGAAVGALRVRLPLDPRESAAGATARQCLDANDLEDLLSECARHVALALKKEADADRAETDGLTGLLVKREFESRLGEAVREAAETSRPVSLLVIDIDHFKRVNDTYGHRSGDLILRGVSAFVRRHVRACDSAFRYGGEELCVILPGSGAREAKATAERLRSVIEEASFSGDAAQEIKVTISAGVAVFDPKRGKWSRACRTGTADTAAELFRRADAAVYSAKRSGRNRVVVWGSRARRAAPETAPRPQSAPEGPALPAGRASECARSGRAAASSERAARHPAGAGRLRVAPAGDRIATGRSSRRAA